MSEEVTQRSRELFDSGFYCAESVLLAIAESQDIHSELIPRIATGFCSGVARTGRTCGAVSGAIMAIGLTAGRNSPEKPVDDTYTLVQSFLQQFEERYGSLECPILTGCDLGTPEGQRHFRQNHLIERCQGYIEGATSIAVSLIK